MVEGCGRGQAQSRLQGGSRYERANGASIASLQGHRRALCQMKVAGECTRWVAGLMGRVQQSVRPDMLVGVLRSTAPAVGVKQCQGAERRPRTKGRYRVGAGHGSVFFRVRPNSGRLCSFQKYIRLRCRSGTRMKRKVRRVKGRRGMTWKGVRLAQADAQSSARSAQRGTGSSKRRQRRVGSRAGSRRRVEDSVYASAEHCTVVEHLWQLGTCAAARTSRLGGGSCCSGRRRFRHRRRLSHGSIAAVAAAARVAVGWRMLRTLCKLSLFGVGAAGAAAVPRRP